MALAICPACGKETKNPRFCDRSCAAKFNNKKSPKRKPEGKCRSCGQPIQTSKAICERCVEKQRITSVRKANNLRAWINLAGQPVECAVPPIYSRQEMVFSSFASRDQLDSNDKIDQLLDRLTSICFRPPKYLRQCHAMRHIVLLNELRHFKCESFGWDAPRREVRVGDLPIDDLSLVLNRWMKFVLDSNFHPMMPSYALDTVTFIQDHVQENYNYSDDRWRIVPLVKPGKREDRIRFIDATFKREFTQRTGTTILLCKVPIGSRIVGTAGEVILDAGGPFLSTASRCHLSSGVYDNEMFRCEETNPMKYDLHAGFEFYGSLFARRTSDGTEVLDPELVTRVCVDAEQRSALGKFLDHFTFHSSGFKTPAHWVEATIDIPSDFFWSNDKDNQISINPVPVWQVEFDQ